MVTWKLGVSIATFNLDSTGTLGAVVGVLVAVAWAVAVGVRVTPGALVTVGVSSSPQAAINKVRIDIRAIALIKVHRDDHRVTFMISPPKAISVNCSST
jgi:hypothetical protein